MDKIAGLGDIVISNNPNDIIKAFSLASCVGITAYNASLHIAGMIHIVLPSRPEHSVSDSSPSYYASTGVPLFIQKLLKAGSRKNELVVSVYGGAANCVNDHFNIGKRNLNAVKRILVELDICYNLVDVGGNISRTLIMDVATGTVKMNTLPILSSISPLIFE